MKTLIKLVMKTLALGLLMAISISAAVEFDGVDDYLNCGSATDIDTMGSMSISVWINPTTIGENDTGYIVEKFSVSNGWLIFLKASGVVSFTVVTSGTLFTRESATSTISLGTWQHFALTWDGVITTAASAKMFINGTEVSYGTTTNGTGSANDDSQNLIIGNRDSDTARSWDGQMACFAIWDSELTVADVAILANGGCRRAMKLFPQPIRFYPLMGTPEGAALTTLEEGEYMRGTPCAGVNSPTGRGTVQRIK